MIAHGSRRQASNDEVRVLTGQVQTLLGGAFSQVDCCFLELASPSIGEAVDACVAGGAREIVLVPYFLSAGNHVHADIPAAVDDARARHAGVPMELRPYLGSAPGIAELVARLAS